MENHQHPAPQQTTAGDSHAAALVVMGTGGVLILKLINQMGYMSRKVNTMSHPCA